MLSLAQGTCGTISTLKRHPGERLGAPAVTHRPLARPH
jgi:hypothetical protein